MATQAALGQTALEERKWEDAVKHLSTALQSSKSPLWLIQRSTAYNRLGQHALALQDAEQGVVAATSRARRELIATAQFRRAVALFGLKRYADARLCFVWCRNLNDKEKGLGLWQAKVSAEFDKLPDDSPLRTVTIKELPDEAPIALPSTGATAAATPTATPTAVPATMTTPPAVTQTPIDKIKHDWYQSSTKVTITLLAKGVPKDKVEVELEARSVHVSFPVASGNSFSFALDPLFTDINPSQSTYNVTPHKIELSIHKATPGVKWPALEGSESDPAIVSAPMATASKAPAYPTSSKSGAKDWDKLATDSLKATKSEPNTDATHKGKAGEDDGDEDEDEDEADPLNGFFKKLYKNADPDTQRAMMKSFTESNGTALSTNWSDVGSRTFETKPPEGVEAKKWGS